MKKINLGSFDGRKNEVEVPIEKITWGRWRPQDGTNKDGSNLTVEIIDSVRVCWMWMNSRAVEDEYENTNR